MALAASRRRRVSLELDLIWGGLGNRKRYRLHGAVGKTGKESLTREGEFDAGKVWA
jgi:hypothetical protein